MASSHGDGRRRGVVGVRAEAGAGSWRYARPMGRRTGVIAMLRFAEIILMHLLLGWG